MGKKEIKTQKTSKREGPRKEPGKGQGECPQDRRAPSQRSRSFTNLPGEKGARSELEQDPRRAGMPPGSLGH